MVAPHNPPNNPRVIRFGSETAKVFRCTGPVFVARCLLCGFQKEGGDGRELYADPDGTPWVAYFCQHCVAEREVQS